MAIAQSATRPATARAAMAGGAVAVIFWGLAPVATRALVAHIAPLPLLVVRMCVASIVLLPWAVPVFRRLSIRETGRLIAAGLLGIVGYTLPVTAGLRWLPASTAGLLLASEPVWVMLLGRLFLAERRPARAWTGSAVALAGVGLLAGPAAVTGASGPRALAGAGLVLAGTLAFGAYTIILRPLSQAHGALPVTAASTVAGTIPFLAFAGTISARHLDRLPASAWGELAFLALGSSVAGMVLWNRAVAAAGSTRVSLLLYLEPVVSVAGAAALLGEPVTVAMTGAGLVILAGVALAGAGRAGGRSDPPEMPPALLSVNGPPPMTRPDRPEPPPFPPPAPAGPGPTG
jgi:drug/metabolite transporter (DMT)-like permease